MTKTNFSGDPSEYPGASLKSSALVLEKCSHQLRPTPYRRLGQALVDTCQTCHPSIKTRVVPLSFDLLVANAATIDSRTPVLAVGSNQSQRDLQRKFRNVTNTSRSVVPIVTCSVTGVERGYSAHITDYGILPIALFAKPGNTIVASLLLLDDDQLERLDRSEPNYERVTLDPGSVQVQVHVDAGVGGEIPRAVCYYRSRHGLLAPDGDAVPFATTAEGLGVLARHMKVTDAASIDVSDAETRQRLRDEYLRPIASHSIYPDESRSGSKYGESESWWDGQTVPPRALRVLMTPDRVGRDGEPCVMVAPTDASAIGGGGHATLRRTAIADAADAQPPKELSPALVRVLPSDEVTPGTLLADQVVRSAIGVEQGEYVEITRAHVTEQRAADVIFGRPGWVMCRVQPADLSTVERPVALLSALGLSLLGVAPGDQIILEGVPTDRQETPSLRLIAHETSAAIADRRKEISGGGFTSRFPSSRDALGVYPDLPEVYLDLARRKQLGLNATKLGTVRIRASRRYQLLTEGREFALIVLLAMLAVAFAQTAATAWILGGLAVLASGGLVAWRVRRRLRRL